jgi:F-type H+-transporting ATPase subunit b
MELVSPSFGLFFWMTISFGLLLFVLGRYAWKPVMKALKHREQRIDEAIHEADRTREEMNRLKSRHEELLKQAQEEREAILREARHIKEAIIEEAKVKANEEADRIVENAKERIHFEKMAAVTELKNQLAQLSIQIAEKLIKEELSKDENQKALMDKLISEVTFN